MLRRSSVNKMIFKWQLSLLTDRAMQLEYLAKKKYDTVDARYFIAEGNLSNFSSKKINKQKNILSKF